MSKCHVCGEETNPMPPHRNVIAVDVTTAHENGIRWGLYHEECYKQLMEELEEFETYMSVFDHKPSVVEVITHMYKPFGDVPRIKEGE